MTKYNARKTTVDGHKFDSRAEAVRYGELSLLQRAGVISDLAVHPRYELQPGFRHNGSAVRPICYEADFAYHDNESERTVVEDVKGMDTPVSALKRKMMLFVHHIEVQVIR